jgi:hypothetical protein
MEAELKCTILKSSLDKYTIHRTIVVDFGRFLDVGKPFANSLEARKSGESIRLQCLEQTLNPFGIVT